MTVTIKPINDDGIGLDKRTYLPFIVSAPCPKCGAIVEQELLEHYLSYPTTGRPYALAMYHSDADGKECEFDVHVVVGLTLTVAP